MVSITKHESGRIDVCRFGHLIGTAETENDLAAIVTAITAPDDETVTIMQPWGAESRLTFREYVNAF